MEKIMTLTNIVTKYSPHTPATARFRFTCEMTNPRSSMIDLVEYYNGECSQIVRLSYFVSVYVWNMALGTRGPFAARAYRGIS